MEKIKKAITILLLLAMMLSTVSALAEGVMEGYDPAWYGPDARSTMSVKRATEGEDEVVYGPKIAADFFAFSPNLRQISKELVEQGMSQKEANAEATRQTMRIIGEMGFQGVQMPPWFSWWDIDAAELKAICDEYGLEQLDTQWITYLYWSEEEWEYYLAYMKEADVPGICVDHNTPSQRVTQDVTKPMTQDDLAAWAQRTIDDINYVFDHYKKYGYEDMTVAYHAHSWELVPIRAFGFRNMCEIVHDTFGDAVAMDIDTAWAAVSHLGNTEHVQEAYQDHLLGRDGLVDYLWENGNMFKWLRLEDVDVKTGLSLPVGQGSLDWKEILSAVQAHGCEWLIIQDHDQASFNRDIYQSFQCSLDYLEQMYITLGWTLPEN